MNAKLAVLFIRLLVTGDTIRIKQSYQKKTKQNIVYICFLSSHNSKIANIKK
jgi:hypothetical protein